ncbi:MAG: nucleotidyltransferase family protein [Promethearchaeota archaeon]
MKALKEIKDTLAAHEEEIRKKYGVVILGIFGSYARGEQNELSDIDVLVDVEKPIGLKFFELWDELENLLGVKVDLLTIKAVKQKPKLWESIKGDVIHV